ncbi:MAG: LLM class flavin-dependent oxidoreductase [Candidatus Limnocylindria bacterium]
MTARRDRPGLLGFRISATDSAGIDWPTLEATWSLAAELEVFDAGWMSDHLSDAGRDHGGGSLEALSTAAALAPRGHGMWIGIAVVANTFRHPAVLAKAATVLDHVTGGRFILGIGAGWHQGEHAQFGIPLPPPAERFDRLESALKVITALFPWTLATRRGLRSTIASIRFETRPMSRHPSAPEDRRSGLVGNDPGALRLAARYAQGWPPPGNRSGDLPYFIKKRDALRRAMDELGRDSAAFTFAAQVDCGSTSTERRAARRLAISFVQAGADHVILGTPGRLGPSGLAAVATEVAEPICEMAP